MINSECKPCGVGYYRNETNQAACIPCPYGQTTYQVGASSSVCKGRLIIAYFKCKDSDAGLLLMKINIKSYKYNS